MYSVHGTMCNVHCTQYTVYSVHGIPIAFHMECESYDIRRGIKVKVNFNSFTHNTMGKPSI